MLAPGLAVTFGPNLVPPTAPASAHGGAYGGPSKTLQLTHISFISCGIGRYVQLIDTVTGYPLWRANTACRCLLSVLSFSTHNTAPGNRRAGRARPKMYLFLCLSFVLSFLFNIFGGIGEKERWGTYYTMTGSVGLRSQKNGYLCKKAHRRCFGSGGADAMALRLHVAGY